MRSVWLHGLRLRPDPHRPGLDGSTSLLALLAFNVGVGLAQLVTVALLFPSLYLASRTRFYPALHVTGAAAALAAATGWALERLGVLGNPPGPAEQYVMTHPWHVVVGLAGVAFWCRLMQDRLRRQVTRGKAGLLFPGPAEIASLGRSSSEAAQEASSLSASAVGVPAAAV